MYYLYIYIQTRTLRAPSPRSGMCTHILIYTSIIYPCDIIYRSIYLSLCGCKADSLTDGAPYARTFAI